MELPLSYISYLSPIHSSSLVPDRYHVTYPQLLPHTRLNSLDLVRSLRISLPYNTLPPFSNIGLGGVYDAKLICNSDSGNECRPTVAYLSTIYVRVAFPLSLLRRPPLVHIMKPNFKC